MLGHACGEPQLLPEAMVRRAEKLKDVEIVHMGSLGKCLYARPEMEGHFIHNGLFFLGPVVREAYLDGRADFTPCFFSELPALFKSEEFPIDVALISVSPPDQHGFCSLGVSVDYTWQAIQSAKMVIAEVNPNMPKTYGKTHVKVEDIDYFVYSDLPLLELPRPKIGKVETRIGQNIAELVDDGATLQLGIGAIPDATLSFLRDKKDLGIHSEMISDGVMELVDSGIINCSRKSLHPHKMVITFLMGTEKLYRWVDNNSMLEFYPVDYVNDPYIIMRNDKMVAINSALQVDALGQVVADTLGPTQFSGVGGQVDFIRGTARSKGGKSIIALPSTAAGGKISRIVPYLDKGAAVTTSRNDVDYIVTEYGIAALKGKTVKERMHALTNICHPDFRDKMKSLLMT